MAPDPKPTPLRTVAPALFVDSCATRYKAWCHAKTGWHLEKQPAQVPSIAFSRPDFPAAVAAGIFTRFTG